MGTPESPASIDSSNGDKMPGKMQCRPNICGHSVGAIQKFKEQAKQKRQRKEAGK